MTTPAPTRTGVSNEHDWRDDDITVGVASACRLRQGDLLLEDDVQILAASISSFLAMSSFLTLSCSLSVGSTSNQGTFIDPVPIIFQKKTVYYVASW